MRDRELESWMWERANDLLERAEKLHSDLFRPGGSSPRSTWQPPVDIFEGDDAFWIVVALPGVDPSRVEVALRGGRLVVQATRSLPKVCQRAIVHRMEVPCGLFERWIELPDGDYEPGEQEFVNGCLVFSMRKVT